MPGGIWETQNKILPGIYINFKSRPGLLASIGDRGVVAIPKLLNWGINDELIEIRTLEDVYPKLGYDVSAPQMQFLREILLGTTLTQGASRVLIANLATIGGVAATATIDNLTVTANSKGIRGNDISIVITPDIDTEISAETYAVFTVETILDGTVQDRQVIGSFTDAANNVPAKVSDLVKNNWVTFSGTASALITPTAGLPLAGGINGTLAPTAYSNFMTLLEQKTFNVVIYDGDDPIQQSAFALFVQRLSYGSGRYCQAVMANYPNADNETVISVKNGYALNDGSVLTPQQAAWWVGGATAGAKNNQSLTYGVHQNAIRAVPRLSKAELEEAVTEGSFAFFEEYDKVKVITDINTFTSFTVDKGKSFKKNRVIRVLFSIANDIYRVYSLYYVGKVDNDNDGRKLLKAEIVGYMNQLQGNGAIQNFVADDIEVLPGIDSDSVIINVAAWPNDAIEKIYIQVTVS